MAVTYPDAIANLVFPSTIAKKEDDGSLKDHHRLVATRFLRKAMQSGKDELVQAVIAASASRKEGAISEEDAELCLKILAAVESLLEPRGLPVPEDGKSADDLLVELGGIDRQEISFTEDNLREHLQVSVASDVEIPPYLEHAIGAFAWTKGAHYDRSYAEVEDDATPPDVPDVISDDQADLFAAMGMGNVIETMKEAVKANVDPLAKARQAAREAGTPPTDRNPGGEDDPRDNTRRNAATGHAVINIDPPPPIPSEVKAAFARMTAHAREVEASNAEYARVSAIVLHLLRGCLARHASEEDAVALYDLVNNVDVAGVATVIFLEASDEELLAHDWTSPGSIAPLLVRKDETFVFTSADSSAFGRAVTERIEVIRNPPPPESAEERERREREAAAVADRMRLFAKKKAEAEAERTRIEEERRAEEERLEAERLAEEARIEAERLAAEEAEKAAAEAAAKAAVKAAAPTPPPAGPPSP